MSINNVPSISVIIPVFNEADYIGKCINSIVEQDYSGKIEILCIDGMSDDGSREIIRNFTIHDNSVHMIDNLQRIIPVAMNIGIKNARYDLVARMDGHSIPSKDYLKSCVEVMNNTLCDCVGGKWEYKGTDYISSAIAAAMDSKFGVGTARWRGTATAGLTDTVPYGVYKKELLLKLDGFNENLIRNQDYELNYRLRQADGQIYYSPDIVSTYYSRKNLNSLWRQYYQYGVWKALVIKMHPKSFRFRHCIAPLFVLSLITGTILSLLGSYWFYIYLSGILLYTLFLIFFSIRQAIRNRIKYLPLLPVIFIILHTSWGSGFLYGIIKWWILNRDKNE